jgi:hypothetical protein
MKIDLQALVVPFVKAFYGEVIRSPKRLAGLYGDESVCFSGGELFKGVNEIVQGSAWRSQLNHQVHTSNVLPCGGNALIVVIGEVDSQTLEQKRCFYETFALVMSEGGRVYVSHQSCVFD